MRCPNCQSSKIGHIAPQQFYCWDCFIELYLENDRLIINQIEEDGTLTDISPIFSEVPIKASEFGF